MGRPRSDDRILTKTAQLRPQSPQQSPDQRPESSKTMDQTSVFSLPNGQTIFIKFAADSNVAIARPEHHPNQGLMDLIDFHQAVPLDGHPPDEIELAHERKCRIELHDSATWRRSNQGFTELGYANECVALYPLRMNDQQLAYFALMKTGQ